MQNNDTEFFSNIDIIAFNGFLGWALLLFVSAIIIKRFARKIPIEIAQIIIFIEISCFLLGLATYIFFTANTESIIEVTVKSILFVILFVLLLHYFKDGACKVIFACLAYNPKADEKIKRLLAKERLSDKELQELYILRKQSSQSYLQNIEQTHYTTIDEENLDPESALEAFYQIDEREFEASDALYKEELKILQKKDN